MEDELDTGLDLSETSGSVDEGSSFDVGSFMDDVPETPDVETFSEVGSSSDCGFDVASVMDEAAGTEKAPEVTMDEYVPEEVPPDAPEPVEPPVEVPPVIPEVQGTALTEIVEETPAEMSEEVPVAEEVITGIPPELETENESTAPVITVEPDEEEIPAAEEITETPVEPEVVEEEVPVAEEVTEIPVEPEVVKEEIPVVEEITETPVEPEVVEEEIPAAEEITETPVEPEVVEEEIPAAEEITETPVEPEVVEEEIPVVEEITETPVEPEVVEEEIPVVEEITETPVEPEVVEEEVPVAEEVTEIPVEAEVVEEEIPVVEEITETPVAPEVVEEEIPVVEEITETPVEAEVVEEEIPAAEEITETPVEAEVVEEEAPTAEEITETPVEAEVVEEEIPAAEEITETPVEPEVVEEEVSVAEEVTETPVEPEVVEEEVPVAEEVTETPVEPEVVEEIPTAEEVPETPAETAVAEHDLPVEVQPERTYNEFEETVRLDQEDFYESGTFLVQGINEYGYEGTCGETSVASTMNLVLGTNEYTENKVLDVAVQEGLCDTSSMDDSGGTTVDQFMELYDRMNETCGGQLEVERCDGENLPSMEEVAARLEEGCTLNVAVDSQILWGQEDPMGSPFPESRATDHWITVTDVHRSEDGTIEGFDIIDSGGGETYVDAQKYQDMCYGTDDLELTDPTCIVVSRKETELPAETGAVPEIPAETVPETEEPLLGPMKPNDTYEANGYTYRTDNRGRIVSASGELHLVDTQDRDPQAQLAAGGEDREVTDDGGHLIATRFGGSPGLENLVAENYFINRSQFKQLENDWAADLAEGNRVIVNIEPYYGVDSERPTHITGSYTVIRPDGSHYDETFSLTNIDDRREEYQIPDDFVDDTYAEFETRANLSEADQAIYDEVMDMKLPRSREGRVFVKDDLYEAFAQCPEDSDQAFELQREIHNPGKKQ